MRQIFVALVVCIPLTLAVLFIVNNVISDTFPLFRESPMDELDVIQQTYEAGLDHCESNYDNFEKINENEEYRKCIDSVETWYVENLK